MNYRIAITQRVMSFEYDHWRYSVVDEIPPFEKRKQAEKYAADLNRREKRIDRDRFNWYYSVIENVEENNGLRSTTRT